MLCLASALSTLQPTVVTIQYLRSLPIYETEKPYLLAYDVPLGNESKRTNLEFEEATVSAFDLRPARDAVRLEHHGFELLRVPTGHMLGRSSPLNPHLDMTGVEELFRERFKAQRVILYDHAVRTLPEGEKPKTTH